MPTLTPRIRQPSLVTSTRLTRRHTTRRRLTPLLPPLLIRALQLALVLLVFYAEVLTFRFTSRGFFGLAGGCKWDDSPSVRGKVWDGSLAGGGGRWLRDDRWLRAKQEGRREGQPFHVLVLADPQILDMHSYKREGRSWVLRKLGVWVTDMFARKAWRAALGSRGKGGGKTDAVMWLGDLLDNTLEAVEPREHAAYIHRFHLLFPLPRASISSFSPLSSSSSSSSSSRALVPPIPSIVIPGNHDLGLHSPSSSLAAYHRERFTSAFGPTFGEREWNGWRVVWIDSMAVLEEEFWRGDGGQFREMKSWLEGLGKDSPTQPTVLLTHIPLFRPEGTSCGRERESSRPIRQGAGRNYQNEMGERETRWVVERVRPTLVFSGDDHDACVIQHSFKSPLDNVTPVVETTVKAFSMAMGVRRAGYHLLSLYAPLPPSSSIPSPSPDEDGPTAVSYTYTSTPCLLPDQLGTYLHLYLPLFGSFLLFFLVPKGAVVLRGFLGRRREGKRRKAEALEIGLPGHGRKTSRSGRGGMRSAAEDDVSADEEEALRHPGLVGGVTLSHLDGVRSPPHGRGRGEYVFDADEEDEEEEGGVGAARGGVKEGVLPFSHPASPPTGHVRRVSRVWLWEGEGEGGSGRLSPSSSSSLPASLPSSSPHSPSSAFSPSSLLSALLDRLLLSLSSNPLLAPLSRVLFRPVLRSLRSVWRKALAPLLLPLTGVSRSFGGLRGRGGEWGRAVGEAVEEVGEVAGPAVGVWVVVGVWYSL
ncbi:hypothetical protein JCM8547_003600 [Rhodosporidiobolus lusitaniae]